MVAKTADMKIIWGFPKPDKIRLNREQNSCSLSKEMGKGFVTVIWESSIYSTLLFHGNILQITFEGDFKKTIYSKQQSQRTMKKNSCSLHKDMG